MKFTKNTVKGFTLIELMVVIAIIGILSTVISTPISTYLKKSRDSKKIADMNELKAALGQYAIDNNGLFPTSLTALETGSYIKKLPASVAAATPAKDKIMYVTYESPAGTPNSYHLGASLEFKNAVLLTDQDCTGATCYSGTITATTFTNIGTTPATAAATAPTSAQDFTSTNADDTATLCNSLATGNNCIYDITP